MAFKIHYGKCIDCKLGTTSLVVVKSMRCVRHNEEFKQSKKSPERLERERVKREAQIKKYQSYKPKARKVTGELDFFNAIWQTREHFCEVCEQPIIRKNNSVSMFSHVLSKGSYPELRLDEENVLLKGDGLNGNCDCHRKWEERTAEMREIPMWKPIFELLQALKEKANHME